MLKGLRESHMVVFMPALGQQAENATCTVSDLFLKEDQDLANRTEEVHVNKLCKLFTLAPGNPHRISRACLKSPTSGRPIVVFGRVEGSTWLPQRYVSGRESLHMAVYLVVF
jgi:hypothetical protein